MAKHWRYFIFLLWISYLIISGILLFTRGFLLSRDAYPNVATCVPQNKIPCTQTVSSSSNITNGHKYHCTQENKLLSLLHDINSASKVCFPARAKVILVIIDALRYDFVTYDSKLENPFPFQNNLPIVTSLLEAYPEKTRLYKFIADPPTTTMQRLKGMTTGSLPTFIDVGSNFATSEINEDNIIDQLVHHNQNIVFMGDDTWSGLYPERFTRSWMFPSFNVFDLDTVDDGIISNIYTEISKADWNLLIAHFLGVDHCGHRYGPYHSEMERKLMQMNSVIKNIIDAMDNETMLFVIGDHGMTSTGDHGADSELEITSAMFIYSAFPLNAFGSVKSIKQIDLVPTLSTILGNPIPFSNLGMVVLDALPIVSNLENSFNNWTLALISLWSNIEQTTNYIRTYSESTDQFKKENLELLNEKYSILSSNVNNVKNELHFLIFEEDAKDYLVFVREMCEEVWVQFDSFSMTRGLLLLFLTLFFSYLIIDGIPSDKLATIFMSSFIFCSYLAMIVSAVITIICYYFSLIENLEMMLLFSTGMTSVFMLAVLVIQHWEIITINWYECSKTRSWNDTLCRVILLLILCTLFSNSYIEKESGVHAYLLLSLVLIIIYSISSNHQPVKTKSFDKINLNVYKFKWNSVKLKLLVMGLAVGILLRISMLYWHERDDLGENDPSIIKDTSKAVNATGTTTCIVTLIFLALFATVTRIWLRSCGNLVGFSPTVALARYAPTVIVVCTGGFWILHRLPKEAKNRIITPWQTDVLAWIVYVLTFIGIFCAVLQPLCVYVLPKKKETMSVYGQENIIPQLFNHVKESLEKKMKSTSKIKDTPIVCGLATVYSAIYVVISVFICLLIALLLGNILAPSSVIMYCTSAIVLAIISIAQYEKSTNIIQMFTVPNSSLLCWMLLSIYFFYGTGHQPTFPAIQWEAAFVGTGGSFTYNAIPAVLIGINTFGSFILMAITLPLLLIAPFTLYVMFPSFCNKQNELSMVRGELLLYENEDSMFNGLLIISCKYILCHGIRMFACMLAATVHCRHLMVWRLFAPKFIFEGIGVMITLPCVLLGYLLFIRINYRVDKLVIKIDKQNR